MCFPPTLRYMELEGVFCLQKFRLQQSQYGVAAAFFISLFRTSYPPGCSGLETSDCPVVVSERFPEAGV